MGLDMYVQRKGKNGEKDEELLYWRKANAINRWFGEHLTEYGEIENCEEYPIGKETLELLLADIKKVLRSRGKEREILPTQAGFFFGDTEYNEWYYETLKETKKDIENLLQTFDFVNNDIYYYIWY